MSDDTLERAVGESPGVLSKPANAVARPGARRRVKAVPEPVIARPDEGQPRTAAAEGATEPKPNGRRPNAMESGPTIGRQSGRDGKEVVEQNPKGPHSFAGLRAGSNPLHRDGEGTTSGPDPIAALRAGSSRLDSVGEGTGRGRVGRLSDETSKEPATRQTVPLRVVPACTHLGLEQDPFNHHDTPSPEHRCYLWMQRDRIDVAHQEMFCLTENSARCPWLSISVPAKKAPMHQRAAQGVAAQLSEKIEGLEGYYQRMFLDAALKFAVIVGRGSATAWRLASPVLLQIGLLLLALLRVTVPYLLWPLRWLSRRLNEVQRSALEALWNATLGKAARTARKPAEEAEPAVVAEVNALGEDGGEDRGSAAERYVRRGLEAMRDGDQVAALRRFRLATASDEANEQAWMLRGALAETPQEKAECLRQALMLNPSNARARAGLAELGVAKAERAASPERVAQTEPWVCMNCAANNKAGADACERCGRPSPNLQAEVAVNGSFLSSGLAAMRAGNEDLAYHYFSLASEAEPENEQAWYWRAKTAPTVDVVIRCLRHLVAINPANTKAQADLAWALQRQEREQQAVQQQAAVDEAPKKAATPSRFAVAVRGALLQLAGVCSFSLGLALALPYALKLTGIGATPELSPYVGLLPSFHVLAYQVPLGPGFDLGGALPLIAGLLLLHAGFSLDGAGRAMRVWAAIVGLGTIVVTLGYGDAGAAKLIVVIVALAVIVTALFGRAPEPAKQHPTMWTTL